MLHERAAVSKGAPSTHSSTGGRSLRGRWNHRPLETTAQEAIVCLPTVVVYPLTDYLECVTASRCLDGVPQASRVNEERVSRRAGVVL
jgi:hypothetical protein